MYGDNESGLKETAIAPTTVLVIGGPAPFVFARAVGSSEPLILNPSRPNPFWVVVRELNLTFYSLETIAKSFTIYP